MLDEKAMQVSRLADQGLSFGPPPEWVVERDIPEASQTDAAVRFLLSDTQIDITGEHAWSHRVVSQALSSEGLNSIASFSTSYLPSFQRLIIHRVRLLRAGVAIDLADAEGFQLLRREPNLERRIYDGALTADLQLSDVRPGDALETWFTIVGSNPALKGLFDASLSLAFSVPVERTFVRLRAPAARRIVAVVKPDGGACAFETSEAAPGVIDREWSVRQEEPFVYDDSTPAWWAGHKRVNIDDELTWGQVADLFRLSYSPPERLPAEIEAEVLRIEALSPDPAIRTIEALRFVQRSIRYLAVSIGAGGFEPRAVEQIWATRFGDCKDVSRFLSAMLVRLGVKACPALVSTLGKDPRQKPEAHVYAFNHCIVRAEIDGVVRWLDATNSGQGGDYARMSQPPFEWALPLVEGSDIERMAAGESAEPVIESKERFVVGKRPTDPVELTVETIMRSWRADDMRGAARREGLAALGDHWAKFYSKTYGGAEIAAPVEMVDDIDANEIRTVERYRLVKAWSIEDGVARFSQVDTTILPDLHVFPSAGRVQPLWLGSPRRHRKSTVFVAPVRWQIGAWNDAVDRPVVKGYTTLLSSLHSAKEFELEVDYAIRRDVLEPEGFDDFLEGVMTLRRGVGVSLAVPLKKGEFVAHDAAPKQEAGFVTNLARVALFVILAAAVIRFLARMAG